MVRLEDVTLVAQPTLTGQLALKLARPGEAIKQTNELSRVFTRLGRGSLFASLSMTMSQIREI